MNDRHPIPNVLNALIVTAQLVVVSACFTFVGVASGWSLVLLCCVFSLAMNSVYSTIHEAHHRILFPNVRVNDAVGVLLALFFPAPFHLLRQGHLGHHRKNRSDDEAFDLYFDYDNKLLKHLAWYGILTGLYWVMVACSSVVILFAPFVLRPSLWRWDRTSEVFLRHFDPTTFPIMRLEAALIVVMHGSILYVTGFPWFNYLVMYYSFGLLWSSLQYVHHYQAERDVRNGAYNLKTVEVFDVLLLNHNWHKTHHQHPCVPWRYLREVARECDTQSESLWKAYLRMWKGPQRGETQGEKRLEGEVSR